MQDGLFDMDPPAEPKASEPAPMSPSQREMIRDLFSQLGVADAKGQFDVVAELTGVRISSAGELDSRTANTLIAMLPGKVARSKTTRTGNSWDDREEDTWIDRL